MNVRKIARCIVAAGLALSSSAFAAPIERALVTKFKTTSVAVFASAEVGGVQYSMTAQNYDDMDGVQQATIAVDRFDFNTFSSSFVVCSGPRFAGTVTVNKISGTASVNATLDPTAGDCYGFNSTTLVINLNGTPTGSFSVSESGTATTSTTEGVVKVQSQSDAFDENFSGSIGYFSGALSGRAVTSKVTQRTRLK